MRAGQAPIHGIGLLPCPLPRAGGHTAVGQLYLTVQSWESHFPSPNPLHCHGVIYKALRRHSTDNEETLPQSQNT